MLTRKAKSRVSLLLVLLVTFGLVIFFIFKSLEDNLVYFFTPTEINRCCIFRLGYKRVQPNAPHSGLFDINETIFTKESGSKNSISLLKIILRLISF